jgi:MFS transporter, DHA1 family, tetracycline resistance protein
MTRRVGPSEQGELQGAIGSLRGIAALIGPAIFTLAFTAAIGPLRAWNLPGAPWYLAALLLALAMLPAWWVTRPEPAAAASSEALSVSP